MHVLMNCLSSVSGGAVAYIRHQVPRLMAVFDRAGCGHQITLLAHVEQRPLLRGINEGRILWLEGARPEGYRRIWWERQNMARIVREAGADVLFTPYQVGPQIVGTRQVLMIRNMEPFLFDAYRYSPRTWLRNRLLRSASARSLRKADRVIAVSRFVRDHLLHNLGIDAARVRTIYHGSRDLRSDADAAQDREVLRRIGVTGEYVLTCGSMLPYRRCEDAIAAFSRAAPLLGDHAQLVIAGSGTDRRYEELIRRAIAASPVCERILPVGQVPSETMAALYRHCQVCVIATEIEACPNIALEAMAAGCAIIAADCPPLPEVFAGCCEQYPGWMTACATAWAGELSSAPRHSRGNDALKRPTPR